MQENIFMQNNGKTVSFEEAKDIIINSIKQLEYEDVSIFDALNRYLFNEIISDIVSPPLDNSGMDGYAVKSTDTKGASRGNPKKLKITGEIRAGEYKSEPVVNGTAVRIMTGAPIPEGADAVIEFEETEEKNNEVMIYREVPVSDNIRFAGENIKKGDLILNRGDRLGPANIGLLASLNHGKIRVFRQPKIAIISTGDEIVDIGEEITHGQIRNSNSYTLYSEIKKYNCLPYYLGIAKDTIEDTEKIFNEAYKYDVIISTGGVSMGKYDFIKDIYNNHNVDIKFEWVKVKPGRPCMFGLKGGKPVFGLPGNQVSTMTSFLQFVRPALLKMMGANKIDKPVVNAILEDEIRKKPDRLNLIRGIFTIRNNEFFVTTTGDQGSGILRSMSQANCLIIVPQETTLVMAGEKVAIQLIEHEEI
jgi:molybdopterin molybdotransferase